MMPKIVCVLFVFGYLLLTESRESVRVREKRGKVARASPIEFNTDVTQDLDANEGDRPLPELETSFLSPSVRKYLELGELSRSIPGRPGTDYPILAAVPYTNFYCDEQPYPGFFADVETRCQGWHYCDIDGRQTTILCPNGTVFSQGVFVCDWWFNVRCDLSPQLYALNARLYQKPKVDPIRPHRVITKQLVDDIFQ